MREIIARNVVVVGQQKPYMDTFGQWHFPCVAATDSATPADERVIDLQFTPYKQQESTMNRPTCGTCPHRLLDAEAGVHRCAAHGPRGIAVTPDDSGCIHHPDMGDWLAQQRRPQQSRSNSQSEAAKAFIGAPTWQQAREKLERNAQSGQQQAATPDQLAELEQWRGAFVWRKDSMDGSWSLVIVRTGTTLSYVMPAGGEWLMSRDSRRYPSRDAAMRAVEAVFGLPKCRVEGEP